MRPIAIARVAQGGGLSPGTLADLTAPGADGTQDWQDATGGIWTGSGGPVINANRIYVNGSSQYLFRTAAAFAFATGDFTIKLIGVQLAVAGNRGLFSTSLSSSPGELALAYDGSRIQLNWNGNETDQPFTPVIGTLYDAIVTRNGTALKVFLGPSGGLMTQYISVTDGSSKTNTTFYLGAYWNSGFTFNGYFARLQIFNFGVTP